MAALYGTPQAIGQLLFREFLLPFEVTSMLILIAIMGAVCASPGTAPRKHEPERELVAQGGA